LLLIILLIKVFIRRLMVASEIKTLIDVSSKNINTNKQKQQKNTYESYFIRHAW